MESARVSNGRLGSWVSKKLDVVGEIGAQRGDDLIFITGGGTLRGGQLLSVRLRADGALGQPAAAGAPLPAASTGASVVQLPDRAVQVTGQSLGISSAKRGACCDVDGNPVDYSSFIPPSSAARLWLGLDRKGRLWLAWMPGRQTKQLVRMVELDPATLAPRGKPILVSPRPAGIIDLLCSSICRVVFTGSGGSFSWAPGQRSPTKIRLSSIISLHVNDRGRFEAAYTGRQTKSGVSIDAALADSLGGAFRVVSSIVAPAQIGPSKRGINSTGIPPGAFGPDGYAALQVFDDFNSGAQLGRVAILPLRR